MHLPQRHARVRSVGALLLAFAVLLPAVPAIAAEGDEPVVLRVGTTQDLLVSNPWNSTLVVDYEAFQLTCSWVIVSGSRAPSGSSRSLVQESAWCWTTASGSPRAASSLRPTPGPTTCSSRWVRGCR